MKKSKQKSILDLKKSIVTVLNKQQIELVKGGAAGLGVTNMSINDPRPTATAN